MSAKSTAALHHVRRGPEGAPVLLLIHPMGADLSVWDGCMAIWEAEYHCISVDLRGSGQSPKASEPLTIESQAANLAAFCDTLALKDVTAIGNAVGAMSAAVLAASRPDLCRALVMSNPGYRTRPEARAMLKARADAVRRDGMDAVMPGAVDRAFEGCPEDERKAAYAARFVAQDRESYACQIEGMLDADISGYLASISCPVLVVAGGRDGLLPPDHAEAVAADIHQSEYVLVPEGAHFMPYQRPDEFAAMVADFLRRHR